MHDSEPYIDEYRAAFGPPENLGDWEDAAPWPAPGWARRYLAGFAYGEADMTPDQASAMTRPACQEAATAHSVDIDENGHLKAACGATKGYKVTDARAVSCSACKARLDHPAGKRDTPLGWTHSLPGTPGFCGATTGAVTSGTVYPVTCPVCNGVD